MTSKSTDRKGKTKDQKSFVNDAAENFILPESLPCSEVEFPIVKRKNNKANWNEILDESNQKIQDIEAFVKRDQEVLPKSPFLNTECDYIKNEVLVHLIPALEDTLNKAKIWEALAKQKCFFNGIDHIVQLLWNNNPRYPGRKDSNLHLFNMPWIRQYLKENPRPYYPKSWLWPEDYAAILIQKTVRQYFVQRDEEVQEMRIFWKKLKQEQDIPDMETNPLLAKKFASIQNNVKN